MKKTLFLALSLCMYGIQAENSMRISNPTCMNCDATMTVEENANGFRVTPQCDCKSGVCMHMSVEHPAQAMEFEFTSEAPGSMTMRCVGCDANECLPSECPSSCTKSCTSTQDCTSCTSCPEKTE